MAGTGGTASRRPGRRLLRLWHLWFGLLVGPWIALLALSGSAIAFYDDLDSWLNPDWRTVAVRAPGAPVAVDRAMAGLSQALPGFRARMIDLPDKGDKAIVTLGAFIGPGGATIAVDAFSHPATGALLGWRETEHVGFDRRHVMNTLYALHVELLAGPTVAWLIGLVGLFWLIDHVPAARLAVPRLKSLASAFMVNRRSGLRLLYDLHRAPALWTFPLTLMLSVTGLCLSWPEETRALVRLVSPVGDRLHYAMPDRTTAAPALSPEQALAALGAARTMRADSILPLPGKGLYAIRSFHPRDPDDMGRLWSYIAMDDGRIVAERHDMGDSAGDGFFGWQYPLHSGRALGDAGRWIVLAAGLACVGLWLSGLMLWIRRRRPSATGG